MNAFEQVTDILKPNVEQLVEYLQETNQLEATAFFKEVQVRLQHVREEDDLLELFMMLSTTAFQGFTLDPMSAMLADRILAYAQQVSHTFSAVDDTRH